MDPVLALVIFVVVFAFVFDYTNGFHDAANAIATSVATRALTPRVALLMAAVMNFIGALLGTGVAETIGSGIVEVAPSDGISGLLVVIAGLVGASYDALSRYGHLTWILVWGGRGGALRVRMS